jgi:hypothetical protein
MEATLPSFVTKNARADAKGTARGMSVAATMRWPRSYRSYVARCGQVARGEMDVLASRLQAVPGVVRAVVAPGEGVAYLNIDPVRFDADAVDSIVAG